MNDRKMRHARAKGASDGALGLRVDPQPRRLTDRAWRARVGLPAIHVGGALRFATQDLDARLAGRREQPRGAA